MQINIDNKIYNIVQSIRDNRAIIDFDGLFVFVDFINGSWELSGDTGTAEERAIIKKLCEPTNDKTIVTIEKDD